MRKTTANNGFKKLAVQWLNEHLFFASSVVLADNFVLRKRQLLKPANSCHTFKKNRKRLKKTILLFPRNDGSM
jgi:hypothetical protein